MPKVGSDDIIGYDSHFARSVCLRLRTWNAMVSRRIESGQEKNIMQHLAKIIINDSFLPKSQLLGAILGQNFE